LNSLLLLKNNKTDLSYICFIALILLHYVIITDHC
jgi:hypothetical protein